MKKLRFQLNLLPLSVLVAIGLIGGMSSTIIQSASAQANPTQVGLVIQFKDGLILKKCVDIEGEQATGYDVLINAGLAIVADFDPNMGAGVCKIENDGCSAAEACFCDFPNYWSYWHLGVNDQGLPSWKYSNLGASSYTVRAGDVEGWHYYNMMAPPDEMPSFEQICAAPTATLAAAAPTATQTSQQPTQISIPPTTPPKWATAVIIGPTPEPLSPTHPAPATAAKTAILPTATPAPTENLETLQSAAEGLSTATPQSGQASPTWTTTQLTKTEAAIETFKELKPSPTDILSSRVAMQAEQATPVDLSSAQPAAPVEAAPTDPAVGVPKWLLIFGGLAGLGSFVGFFLVLLGGLLAVIFLRRR